MKTGWVFGLVFVLAVAFLFAPAPAAAESPDVTILPDQKVLSVNSSVLIKVDPNTDERPIRVTWSVYNTGSIGMGSFVMAGGEGVCYFSNSDGNATCGPSPFFSPGPTEFYVNVITPTTVLNRTIPLNISSVSLSLSGVSRSDNTVYMYFYMGQKAWMKYSIYKEDLSIYQTERPLEYDVVLARYAGNITLNPGVYYFTFMVNDTGTYGSTLKRIEIPSGDYLTVQASKAEYWTGERVRITGTTGSASVTGEIRYPNGDKAQDLSAVSNPDHTFSYEFFSESDWPEGTYEIRMSSPLVKTATFSIVEFFELRPDSISAVVNKSGDFSSTMQIKNLRQNSTNVSLSTSGDLKNSYVGIDKTVIAPSETAVISIDIPNVAERTEGSIIVKAGEGLELAIPVIINVIEPGAACTAVTEALLIEKETSILSKECIDGEPVYHEIDITNTGTAALEGFSYSVEDTGGGDQYLETLDRNGYVDVPVSGLSIGPGETESIEIQLTPSGAGKYEGLINIQSGGDTASLFVLLSCYENITGGIAGLYDELAGKSVSDSVKSDISDDISKAESALTLGNYAQANEYYQKAQAKIDMLGAGGGGAAMDFTWVIIVVVIVVLAGVFVWFFKLRKPGGPAAEEGVDELEKFA